MSVDVTYNGALIATISKGQKTILCKGKIMLSDIIIKNKCRIAYNGIEIASLKDGEGVTVKCSGNRMLDDLKVTALEMLAAPTISLMGYTMKEFLNIEDNSGEAESYDIYVDGAFVLNTTSTFPSTSFITDYNSHQITVKAKAVGYEDSEMSNAVTLQLSSPTPIPVISITNNILTIENYDSYPTGTVVTVNFMWMDYLMTSLQLTEKTTDLINGSAVGSWFPATYDVFAYATVNGTDTDISSTIQWTSPSA